MEAKDLTTLPIPEVIDNRFLESLVGYHARRASMRLVSVFAKAVDGFDLKVVEFSTLSLIKANPGITSSHICQSLRLLPPNVVTLVNKLIRLGYITKKQHVHDRRAAGLYMTEHGAQLVETLEQRIQAAEAEHLRHLSASERQQLIKLLTKTYL